MNHAPPPAQGARGGLSSEELRAAVRAVLREALPAGVVADAAGTSSGGAADALPGHGEVAIATDADLTALLRRVAVLCEDPQQRAAFRDGRHGFRLARQGDAAPAGVGRPAATRIDRGAVTERAVLKAAADGASLVLGRGAVLTPLARDKARSLGVEIERER